MSIFSFQSVKTLKLSVEDNPHIEIKEDQLYLSAERGGESILISVPAEAMLPITSKIQKTKVKVPSKTIKSRVENVTGLHYSVGSDNKMAKLTEENVRDIRTLLNDKDFVNSYRNVTQMYKDVAKSYKVSAWAIKNVAENISWKHVKS